MARTNNLSNFLTDVAGAIKEKKGDNTNIPAANFDTEILALPSRGTYQNKQVNITTNGNYDVIPDEGYDAMEKVRLSVDVSEAQLQTKTYNFTTNQTIELLPDTGYDGFDSIVLTINVPGGGTANLQTKSVTYNRNKTYETYADVEYDGLEKVIATVQTPYNAKLFLNTTEMNNDPNPQLNDIAVLYGMIPTAIPENTVFNKWYLPKTIILPRAVTVEIPIKFNAGRSGTTLSISSTYFTVSMQLENDMVNFQYSSVDGITYTRGDVNIELMGGTSLCKFDEDTNMLSYTPPSYDSAMSYTIGTTEDTNPSEIVGKFFSNGQYQYNGIYKYQGTTNSSLFSAISDIYINNHNSSDYDTWTIDGDMKYDKSWSDIQSVMTKVNTLTNNNLSTGMIEYITNRKMRVYLYKYHNSSNTYYSNLTLLSLYNYNGDKNTYVGCNIGSSYLDGVFIYEVDLDNDSIQDVTSQYTINTITVTERLYINNS